MGFTPLPPSLKPRSTYADRPFGESASDGNLEMLFLVGSIAYMATWLLPFAGSVKVIEPVSLQEHLSKLAKQAYDAFDVRHSS